jgi:hypothetical protein
MVIESLRWAGEHAAAEPEDEAEHSRRATPAATAGLCLLVAEAIFNPDGAFAA